MTRILLALLRRNRASATVELAIILPVMIFIVAGIVEFGRIFEVYVATNRLATQFAFSWASCPDDSSAKCGTELTYYTNGPEISNVVPQLALTGISLSMIEYSVLYLGPASITLNSVYKGGFCNGSQSPNPCGNDLTTGQSLANAAAQTSQQIGTVQYVVVVIASYSHSLSFFNTLMNPLLGSYLTPTYSVAQLKNQTSSN
jgi:hypothetical protein